MQLAASIREGNCMDSIKPRFVIPKMQLLQRKKWNVLDAVLLEIENISLGELLLKYPIINKEETGNFLRELMRRKGISIKHVQKYLGLACVQSIYHWLDGKTLPSVDNLYALSQLLQVPMDELVRGSRVIQKSSLENGFLQRMQRYCLEFCG